VFPCFSIFEGCAGCFGLSPLPPPFFDFFFSKLGPAGWELFQTVDKISRIPLSPPALAFPLDEARPFFPSISPKPSFFDDVGPLRSFFCQ